MKYLFGKSCLISVFAVFAIAAPPIAPASFENEQLNYNLVWPSGLTLGEATMTASSSSAGADARPQLHFQFDLDGSIPGFSVADRYHSNASAEFCSAEFTRDIAHGSKKVGDKTTFNPQNGTATRSATGGSSTDFQVSQCSRDALAFLYYVRHELSEGRVPPTETVYWGVPYDVHLELSGSETIHIADKSMDADRYTVSVRGPSSSLSFEMLFLRDPARTPALVRVPLALGTFSMQLVK
jgi:hypothetical protein